MKRIFLISTLIFLILIFPVNAIEYIGVGLRWNTEGITAPDLEETCVTYGIYNPFDVDVTARLVAEGEIKEFVSKVEPKEIFIPAHTSSKDALAVDICFSPPLRFPPFYPKMYKGTVLASYETKSMLAGTGSATGASVQAPLEIMVGSMAVFNNFLLVLVIVIIIIILILLRKKIASFYRTIKIGREAAKKEEARERLRKLREEEKKLKKKLRKK